MTGPLPTRFLRFLPLLDVAALDDHNFVKKAVNWALRQIGKRNSSLNVAARALAGELVQSASRPALRSAATRFVS
jgi:3-methyladenine DNA glycosylase AlkD